MGYHCSFSFFRKHNCSQYSNCDKSFIHIHQMEENMAKKIVIAGACRTAIGKMGGALSNTPAVDLGSIVIKEALNR